MSRSSLRQRVADEPRHRREGDVLVVARLRLGGGREDRLGQPVASRRPAGSATPHTAPVRRYSFQPLPDEVAAHDALDGQRRRPGDTIIDRPRSSAAGASERARQRRRVGAEQVVGDEAATSGEPEARQAGQHPALVGDGRRQHHVEGADAVRRDEQQPRRRARTGRAPCPSEREPRHAAQRADMGGLLQAEPGDRSGRGVAQVGLSSKHAASASGDSRARPRLGGDKVGRTAGPLVSGQGSALDEVVGRRAFAAGIDQRQQQPRRCPQTQARSRLRAHPRRVDAQPVDDAGHLHQHVVEQRRRVGQDHPLHRRVADVAFVPQRLVLERGQGIAAQQRARPLMRSAVIGLRLCGIAMSRSARPKRLGDSAISVCWRWRISVAMRSSVPPQTASRASSAAWRSRCDDLRCRPARRSGPARPGPRLDLGLEVAVGADRARKFADAVSANASRSRGRSRSSSNASPQA